MDHGLCKGDPQSWAGGSPEVASRPRSGPSVIFPEPSQAWSEIPKSTSYQVLPTCETGQEGCCPHFPDAETEAQGRKTTCRRHAVGK